MPTASLAAAARALARKDPVMGAFMKKAGPVTMRAVPSQSRPGASSASHSSRSGQATAQVQALSRRLVDAQESERRLLARELHDRVGQNLTALSINLGILRTHGVGAERTVDKLWKLCGRILDEFQESECRNYFQHCGYRHT